MYNLLWLHTIDTITTETYIDLWCKNPAVSQIHSSTLIHKLISLCLGTPNPNPCYSTSIVRLINCNFCNVDLLLELQLYTYAIYNDNIMKITYIY